MGRRGEQTFLQRGHPNGQQTHDIYAMDYYAAIKRNETWPLAMTWMELEGIMLSEISQSEKDNYHMISLI